MRINPECRRCGETMFTEYCEFCEPGMVHGELVIYYLATQEEIDHYDDYDHDYQE